MKKLNSILFLLLPVILVGLIVTSDSVQPAETESRSVLVDSTEYVGAAKCKTCHRKPETGEQYPIWENSAHSKAYETLASDEAKVIAVEKGIDNPQTAAQCLECHVTAYDADASLLGTKYSIEDGVGCESCHGPGGEYYKKKTMESITKGEIDGASVGLLVPDEATCTSCHNERSPNFDGFDFEARKAEIAHPIPDERKAAL